MKMRLKKLLKKKKANKGFHLILYIILIIYIIEIKLLI